MPKSNMAELLRLDWKNGRQILNLVWFSVEMGKLAYMQLSPFLLFAIHFEQESRLFLSILVDSPRLFVSDFTDFFLF